jgi:PAS domain S-box-containing protein
MLIINPDGTVRDLNKAALKLLGYNKDEVIGKSVDTIILPEPAVSAAARLRTERKYETKILTKNVGFIRLLNEGFVNHVDMIYLTKDRRKIPVSFSGVVMRDKNGVPTGLICVGKDLSELKTLITEIERARDELAEKVKLLETFESITVDRELKIMDMEKEIEKLKARIKELEA